MKATYRLAGADDVALILPMMSRFYAIDGYPMDESKSRSLLTEFVSNPVLGKIWIVETDKPVGYAILTLVFSFEFGGRIAFIDELYLDEACRGRGNGRQTIAFIKEKAREMDVKMLYLEVEHHNVLAQKLYLSAGFETHHRKFMKYPLIK